MGEIICNDGITRLLIIRKKFKGRNKRDNNIAIHSIILVGTREWEVVARNKKQQADLLFVYSKDNIVQLKKKTNINRIIFGEEEDAGDIEFDENCEEVPTQTLEEILKPSDTCIAHEATGLGLNPLESSTSTRHILQLPAIDNFS